MVSDIQAPQKQSHLHHTVQSRPAQILENQIRDSTVLVLIHNANFKTVVLLWAVSQIQEINSKSHRANAPTNLPDIPKEALDPKARHSARLAFEPI
jgi:hypothetical protein